MVFFVYLLPCVKVAPFVEHVPESKAPHLDFRMFSSNFAMDRWIVLFRAIRKTVKFCCKGLIILADLTHYLMIFRGKKQLF